MIFPSRILLSLSIFIICLPGDIGSQITRPIGTNLVGIEDWSEEFVFVDIMNQSREWIAHDLAEGAEWQSDVSIPLRPDGYPIEIPYDNAVDPPQGVRSLMYFGELEGIFPAGEYRLIIEGTGQVRLWGAASGTFQCPLNTLVSVDNTSSGIAIEIEQSLISDPIHNIRFIMPGFENVYETQPFHPKLLEFLEDFQVIRFMDWMKTNGSEVEEWNDRNTPENYTQTASNGVSYEYMIELANLLQKDIWINVPHKANDNFISELARLFRDNLDPSLIIYLEYSNELWNGIFPQYTYAADQGFALGFEGEPWERAWTFTAKRSADVFQIFENEFVNDDRLIKVLPGFAATSYVSNFIVERFEELAYNPNQITADALTIAPYFGGSVADDLAEADMSTTVSVDEILDDLEASLIESYSWMDDHKTIADQHGLDLIAYEGGQHLVANYPHNNDPLFVQKLLEANRDPRMQTMYCDYFDYWYNTIQGGLFAHFSSHGGYSEYGSWGVKENYEDDDSPKYQALINCVFDANHSTVRDVTLGIESIELYANPNPDVFIIQGVLYDYHIEVFDANQVLYQEYVTTESQLSIDLASLPDGMYFISIRHKYNYDVSLKKILKM